MGMRANHSGGARMNSDNPKGKFDDFVKKHEIRLLLCALSITHDQQDAEDAVQEGLLKVFLSGMWEFAFAVVCVRNCAIDLCRRRKKDRLRQASGRDAALASVAADQDDDGAPEVLARVLKVISRLPPDQQEAIDRRARGESFLEIAKAMERKVSAVHSLLSRARQTLHNALQQDLFR
jgi:RNA polymerase sigma factor (sigma-70 family)